MFARIANFLHLLPHLNDLQKNALSRTYTQKKPEHWNKRVSA